MFSRLALLVAALAIGIHFASRATFPVLTKGVVVITGASSGIGEHAAAGLAEAGYTVYAGVRSEKDAARLKAKHPKLVPLMLDVTKADSIQRAVEEIKKVVSKTKPLVAVVNNAGVQKDLPVELQSSENDRWTYDVNVFGLFDVTRAFIPLLRQTGPGARIVNMGSLSGIVGAPGSATYVSSKFAVEGFTDCLRMEMAHFQISVSLIEPGYVQSEMATKLHADSNKMYGVSKENFELYNFVFSGFFAADEINGNWTNSAPAHVTTDAVLHAVMSPHPQTRYVVAIVNGLPAWLVAKIRWLLPDRLMDILTLNF